jgi:hypothetical protein
MERTLEDWAGAQYLRPADVEAMQEKIACITQVLGFVKNEKWNRDDFVLEVELPNQRTARLTLNKTSARNLLKTLGSDTTKWKDAMLELESRSVMVRGEQKKMLVVTAQAPLKPEIVNVGATQTRK